MNKIILASTVVALSASTAFAGMYGDTADTETDPYIPVETAAASSSAGSLGAGGLGTALAVVGGVVLVGSLMNTSSSSGSD